MTCTHCRAGSSPFEKEYLNIPKFKDKLIELKSIGLKHIRISGGERFLIYNFGEFTEYLISENFEVTITTNGTISIDKTDLLKFIGKEHKVRLRVSIDGDKVLHEKIRGEKSFKKTVDNLKTYKHWNNWLVINKVVLMKL